MKHLNFDTIFDTYFEDNQTVFEFDRKLSLGASSAFGCIRRSFFSKHDYAVDAGYVNSWGAMARGSLMEDHYIVPAVENFIDNHAGEFEVVGIGEDQKTFVKGKLSATPDSLFINLPSDFLKDYGIPDIKSDCIIVEYKSIDPRVNLAEAKAIHEGQVHVQMGLIRDETKYKPMYAVILYIDCSFFDNMKIFIHKFEPKTYKMAHKRADKVYAVDAEPADFVAEGKLTGACDLCEYRTVCADVVKDGIPSGEDSGNELDPADEKTAMALVNSERAIHKQMKEAEKTHKAAKAALSDFLKDKGRRLVRSPDFSVSISWRDGRKSFDAASLRERLEDTDIDLDDFYTTGLGYEVVTVKKR